MYKRYLECVQQSTRSEDNACASHQHANGFVASSKGRPPQKLVLHFDARNTIFVADLFSRISVEQALNTYIAGVVWGIFREDGRWECISEVPSLRTPVPEAISMYKLMERDIVRVPSDRAQLRQQLGDFTQTPNGRRFASYFNHHLTLLKWPSSRADSELTVTGLDGCRYHYLLPAFLRLIAHLHDSGAEFSVIIRTFGRDAQHILTAVRRFLRGEHPDFPAPRSVPVAETAEKLSRAPDGSYRYSFVRPDGSQGELDSQKAIYEHWNASKGVMGVVDDFVHWQKNDYHFSAAKPLWFDPNDHRHQHIMFDDNIRVDDHDNILKLSRLGTGEKGDVVEEPLSPEQAKQFEDVFFVQADLLQSTANATYFIEKAQLCVDNLIKLRAVNPTLLPS